jgi:hypothetical protein
MCLLPLFQRSTTSHDDDDDDDDGGGGGGGGGGAGGFSHDQAISLFFSFVHLHPADSPEQGLNIDEAAPGEWRNSG